MATTSPNKPLQQHQKSNIVVENSTAPIESKRKQTSYAEGIANALTDINHPNGSSTAGIIKKYMQANLPANETWSNYIFKSSLQKMIAKGDIIKSVVLSKNMKLERYNLSQPKAVSQEDAAAAEVTRDNTKKKKRRRRKQQKRQKRRRKRRQRPMLKKLKMNRFWPSSRYSS